MFNFLAVTYFVFRIKCGFSYNCIQLCHILIRQWQNIWPFRIDNCNWCSWSICRNPYFQCYWWRSYVKISLWIWGLPKIKCFVNQMNHVMDSPDLHVCQEMTAFGRKIARESQESIKTRVKRNSRETKISRNSRN